MTLVEGIHYQDFFFKCDLLLVILQRSASENWTEVISNPARITCVLQLKGVSCVSRAALAL